MTKTKEREGLLPKIEMIIVGVFFVGFILLLIPKCTSKKKPSVAQMESDAQAISGKDSTSDLASALASLPSVNEKTAPLYVAIEGLKLRTEPNVNAEVITKLALFEKVYYLHETTDFKKEIDWGNNIVTNEPWVKIRTESGRSGWVYGVGVHFYKRAFEPGKTDTMNMTK
jgi:uncharacterized protein YgiM (DUF1202 family)